MLNNTISDLKMGGNKKQILVYQAILLLILLLAGTVSYARPLPDHEVDYAVAGAIDDQVEFLALKTFYDSLGGSGWTNKSNWPTPGNWPASATVAQMSTWYGVSFTNGDVSGLSMAGNNLVGKIPAAISDLKGLVTLSLPTNSITKIPSAINELTNLTIILLNNNLLTGGLPDLTGLVQLSQLDLKQNPTLTLAPIPTWIGSLINLKILDLSNTKRNGAIPSFIGNLTKLTTLNLNTNQLTSAIPSELVNDVDLVIVNMYGNQLSGSIPSGLGSLIKVTQLNLSSNQLSGNLTEGLFSGMVNMNLLNLSNNQLSGMLPSSMGGMTKLANLDISVNQFTGVLPATFSALNKLTLFNIQNNQLSGELPASLFSTWTVLSSISLQQNGFTGPFPSSIGSCTSLTYLRADLNKFTTLPASMLNLASVTTLFFRDNELKTIPDFGSQVNKANLALTIGNNRLDFSQLEQLIGTGIKTVNTPLTQNTINDFSQLYFPVDAPLVITTRPTGGFSTVTWEKQNANATWSAINTDQDNIPQTYTRNAMALTDEGNYRWKMTNSKVTGVTLQSEAINVKASSLTISSATIIPSSVDNANGGSIQLVVSGGTTPYAYNWSSGETTSSISNKAKGAYTVTVTDAGGVALTRSYNLGYKMEWADLVNVTVASDNSLNKAGTSLAWDAGSGSYNLLPANTDGWMEFVVNTLGDIFMYGFSSSSIGTGNYPRLNYAFHISASNDIQILESSTQIGLFGKVREGDVFRISREGSTIKYYRNGVVLRTSTNATDVPLQVGSSISKTHAPVVTSSFAPEIKVTATIAAGLTTGGITVSVQGGTAPYTYSWNSGETTSSISNKAKGAYTLTVTDAEGTKTTRSYNLGYKTEWADLVNVTVASDNSLNKAGTSLAWDAGSGSYNLLPANTDGWMEFVVNTLGDVFIYGFSSSSIGTGSYQRLNYAIYILANNDIQILESSTSIGTYGKVREGDVFRISREGSTIKYYRNGVVLRTTLNATDVPLQVGSTIFKTHAPVVTSSFAPEIKVTATIAAGLTTGGITVSVQGGTAPYTYSWNSGETTSSISNKAKGAYTLTVTDAEGTKTTRSYNLGYKTEWADLVNVTVASDNSLNKAGTSLAWDAGSGSYNLLPANTDGWMEFVVNTLGDVFIYGFSSSSIGTGSYQRLNYAIYILASNDIQILESSTSIGFYGKVREGDVFRISREGSTIKYYRNGVILRTTTNATNVPLQVGSSIFKTHAPVVNSSFAPELKVTATIAAGLTTGGITLSVQGGIAPYTYSWNSGETTSSISNKVRGTYIVTVADAAGATSTRTYSLGYKTEWTDLKNVTVAADNSLNKTGTSQNWDAGSGTSNILQANADGWLEFVVNSLGDVFIYGLTPSDVPVGTGINYQRLSYAIYITAANDAVVYESGVSVGTFGKVRQGDVFRVSREGTSIKYYHNGVLLKTKANAISSALQVGSSISKTHAPIVTASFWKTLPLAIASDNIIPLTLKDNDGGIQVTVSGGTAPYTYLWSSGEATAAIASKPLGAYSITVTDATSQTVSATYYIGYRVQWTDLIGTTASNGVLTKTTTPGWGNASATSTNLLPSYTDGWIEFILPESSSSYTIGLGIAGTASMQSQIRVNGQIGDHKLYASGSNGVSTALGDWKAGDVFRVSREGATIKHFLNNQEVYSVQTNASEKLIVKVLIELGSSPAVITSFLSEAERITRLLNQYAQQDHSIPSALKITRVGTKVLPAIERKHILTSLQEGDEEDVFHAPPCLEGTYYAGFQLYYDLGDSQTQKDWALQVEISLLHASDTLWTRPLQLNMREQTFTATVFHDSLISCEENYRYVIRRKTNLGTAPEGNIYLKVLLHRMDKKPFSVNEAAEISCTITDTQSLLTWSHSMQGVSAFDVEWVFIDSLESTAPFTAQNAFKFKEPVRVTLSGNTFGSELSNYLYFYPKGRVWHRVRAVGYNASYPKHRINGQWSYGCSDVNVNNQQPDKNWARQTVFAEEGKFKEVVRYFDGTTRERQVQTNLSTEEVTLVGESLYDFEGRASVQILPVPSADKSLKYKPGFNQFTASDPAIVSNTSSDQVKFHYDNRRLENSILSDQSGAANYYSAANSQSNLIHKDYIPLANGYAYTQTEFTNDGTGRVSRQSGVGETFRLDGGHTTRSFYGSVAKPELVRLFGSNAGNATHYKKTMVLDANNQVSVTYQDQEGRTIATALAGDNPSNVDALESYTNLIPTPLTIDISDRNEKSNNAWVLNHTILNAVPNTPYTFKYDLAALASQVDTIGCEGCVFDLEMVLTDPDGAPVSLASVAGNEIADGLRYLRSGITVASCTDTLKVNDIDFTLLLSNVGDYTLTKTLTPRELSFERMQQLVEQTPAVLDQISQLTGLYSADSSECAICTESESAIKEAIEEVATQDCESILQQILSELRAPHENDSTVYEPKQTEIEGHALYCQYRLCTKDKAGDVFDRELSRYEGWTTATAAGYTNLLEQDPFFNVDSLSGYNYKGSMQGKLNDVLVANVGYDNNGDGEQDGTTSYHGAIGTVTDPLNTAFYIDNNGNADVNGHHLLYAYAMSQRAELGETEYQKQLDAQHWSLYRNFYGEAKRRTKLEIAEYKNCPGMKAQLGATDELPQTPDEVEVWAAQQDVTLVNEVSVPELNTALYNIKTKCDVQFSPADSTSISNHLQSYFNSNKSNFFRVLIKTDLAANAHLTAIQSILNNYSGCRLDSIAVDDPLTCLKTTTITIPAGLQSAVPRYEQSTTSVENATVQRSTQYALASYAEDETTANAKSTEAFSSVEEQPGIKEDALQQQLRNKAEAAMMAELQQQQDSILKALQQAASTTANSSARSANTQAMNATIPLTQAENDALQAEYDALIDLYNSTGGAYWKNTRDNIKPWNPVPGPRQSVENWYGVTLDANGHITTLGLSYNQLTGAIPASIDNLSNLTYLYLYSNQLTGAIPAELGNLSSLTYLNLSNNQLTGGIPAELGNLSNLTYLNLSNNQLTGGIPAELGNLSSLTYLDLLNNQLTGGIPAELGNLSSLTYLGVGNNRLTGAIPGELGNLSNLTYLYLYSNQLTGAIPAELGNLSSLTSLSLAINRLTGIPAELGNLSSLTSLSLNNNQLTGAIPAELGNLSNLVVLSLNNNQLTGVIPAELGNLSNLEGLYLYSNQLTGAIPAELGNLSKLVVLYLYSNQLTGGIPAELGNLSSLTTLRLGKNQLTGAIPGELGNLSNLTYLDLFNNQLTGAIPAELGNLSKLVVLYLFSNQLTGAIPAELGNLGYLEVYNNSFTFTDLVEVKNNFTGYYFTYAPQDSVDIKKIITTTAGSTITLMAAIDRNTSSDYQWFRQKDGVVTSLTQPVLNGYEYVIQSASLADGAEYYYVITNSSLPGLDLTSRIQTLQVEAGSAKTYSICTYDENNPSLNRFTYTVDWNQQIVECMARQAKADSVLTEMAIEKLMDQRVSAYYNQYATQCLSKAKEKMTYTYLSKEYHYTLYYFDQGANLVQTVPPEGVHPLSTEQTKAFVRGVSAEPAHGLITRYQYNSLNQLVTQTTPDAGESDFLYNNKGQLRLSQNAQQQQDNVYSYTKYDEQGRILEVGETGITLPIHDPVLLDSIHTTQFPSPHTYALTDVTKTHYDFADTTSGNGFTQDYLRSRVAWVEVIDKEATDTVKTHYSYDLHGNVKSLQQSVPGLKSKRTDYVYDLVSGKVNYVMYQYGKPDQFIHEYAYDADNRIIQVATSSDGYLWSKEAEYDYYLHGPLARTVLGQYRVQGLDYYYTLQGWIKGVNMPYAGDPGADGLNGNKTGKDVFAYTLGYYNGDYTPINTVTLSDSRDKLWDRALENIQHTGLYNGNISFMVTDLPKIGAVHHDRTKGMQGMLYRYDQLHRITQSRSLTNYSQANGFAARGVTSAYDEEYVYDANGNIKTLKRNDELATLKDDFAYDYYTGTNKLKNVKTIQTQNYSYDAIGNLVNDAEEGVTINWTPYGKVRNVQKGDSITTSYRYDASGNRVEMKVVKSDTTLITRYLRDASGNVMSIYKDTTTSETPIYGSSRLGQYKGGVIEGHRTLGHRNYELSNHLGNVLAVITDNAGMKPDSVWATVSSTSDYYPFGLDMKGRSYNDTTSVYRYGFNGKEKDNFNATVYDYGFRIYNPEIAKFLSVDPLTDKYPMLTPYQFAGDSPIESIDLDGMERQSVGKDGELLWTCPDDATSQIHNPAASLEIKKQPQKVVNFRQTFIGPDNDYRSPKQREARVLEIDYQRKMSNLKNSVPHESLMIGDGVRIGMEAVAPFVVPAAAYGKYKYVLSLKYLKEGAKIGLYKSSYSVASQILVGNGSNIDVADVGTTFVTNTFMRGPYQTVTEEFLKANITYSSGNFTSTFNGTKSKDDALIEMGIGLGLNKLNSIKVASPGQGSDPYKQIVNDVLVGAIKTTAKTAGKSAQKKSTKSTHND